MWCRTVPKSLVGCRTVGCGAEQLNVVQNIWVSCRTVLNSQRVQNSAEQLGAVQNSSEQFGMVKNSAKQFIMVHRCYEQFSVVQNSAEHFSLGHNIA